MPFNSPIYPIYNVPNSHTHIFLSASAVELAQIVGEQRLNAVPVDASIATDGAQRRFVGLLGVRLRVVEQHQDADSQRGVVNATAGNSGNLTFEIRVYRR